MRKAALSPHMCSATACCWALEAPSRAPACCWRDTPGVSGTLHVQLSVAVGCARTWWASALHACPCAKLARTHPRRGALNCSSTVTSVACCDVAVLQQHLTAPHDMLQMQHCDLRIRSHLLHYRKNKNS
jgi:hypothetical protein